jgi:hypothetical protein
MWQLGVRRLPRSSMWTQKLMRPCWMMIGMEKKARITTWGANRCVENAGGVKILIRQGTVDKKTPNGRGHDADFLSAVRSRVIP